MCKNRMDILLRRQVSHTAARGLGLDVECNEGCKINPKACLGECSCQVAGVVQLTILLRDSEDEQVHLFLHPFSL